MDYDQALAAVNGMKMSWAGLGRAAANAAKDKKITPFEGMDLAMRAMSSMSMLAALFQAMDDDLRMKVVYVLEHGVITLPAAMEDMTGNVPVA